MTNLRSKNALFFLFIWLGISIPSSALATTYYVDTTDGFDTNTGLSTSVSWKTIAKINLICANLPQEAQAP